MASRWFPCDPKHEDVPDIEGNRSDYDIASFPVEPGVILIFHPLTPCTMPYLAEGLEPGEIVRGPAFPQVLPPAAQALAGSPG